MINCKMFFFLVMRNLSRNFRRTLAILFTIALGTGALFAFDGFINGVLNELKYNTIHSNYGYGQIHTKGYRDKVFEDPTSQWIMNDEEVEKFLLQLDDVDQVFKRVSFSALITKGDTSVAGAGQGVEAEKEADFFHSLNIEEGEMLSHQPDGILLGKGLASALQVHPGDTVDVLVTSTKGVIGKEAFVVTGIFHTGSIDFDGRIFRIQLGAAQKLLHLKRIELMALGLRDGASWDALAEKIDAHFPQLEATPFHVLDKIYYQNSVDWLKAQFNIVQIIILTIVLLGIFNTISAAVLERKQEIGNLRANGESVAQVMQVIVTEGAVLSFLGSLIGLSLVFGVLMLFVNKGILMPPGPGQTRQFLVTFSFEWGMVAYSLMLSCVAAMIASFFAGFKITRMPIAQALRSY